MVGGLNELSLTQILASFDVSNVTTLEEVVYMLCGQYACIQSLTEFKST